MAFFCWEGGENDQNEGDGALLGYASSTSLPNIAAPSAKSLMRRSGD